MIDYNDLVMKMKASKIIVLALALAALLPSCAKDVEETPAVTKVDCSFKINISDITGNSVKLSAIPTKMSVKYCLSAVRSDIYELYSDKNEFAADNLIDMKTVFSAHLRKPSAVCRPRLNMSPSHTEFRTTGI